MKPGDLVIPRATCAIHDIKEPTFSSRGKSRVWNLDQIAIIVAESTRKVKNQSIVKYQILIENELWWVAGGLAMLMDDKR